GRFFFEETAMMKSTKINLALGLAIVASLAIVQVNAQPARYPDRPIKILVGFAAGGGTDVAAPIPSPKLKEKRGHSVVVENRAGASGMIAADAVAKSPPDSYTLMMGTQTTLAVAPNLYRKFALDPAKEFAGVSMAGESPLVLVVHPSLAAHSVN